MIKNKFSFDEGEVLLMNKPYGMTSFGVVKKLKHTLKIKKIGHAGTLDPLATGLLILCTGKKTKEINYFQHQEKEYEGVMTIGKTTPSIDLETDFNSETDFSHISTKDILALKSQFIGSIQQIPPVYSAIKVNGKRAYQSARKGEDIKLKPKEVTIKTFEMSNIKLPDIYFKISCTKGTYIRSIVRDFGEALGVGAYLTSLKRTRIGEYRIEDAIEPDDFLARFASHK